MPALSEANRMSVAPEGKTAPSALAGKVELALHGPVALLKTNDLASLS